MSVLLNAALQPALKRSQEDWLYDPLSFHRPRKTWLCLACLSPDGAWKQTWIQTWALSKELKKLDLTQDWWISQAEFSATKRDVAHVAYVQSNFIDLDWKKSPAYQSGFLPEPDDESSIDIVEARCRSLNIPFPNVIVFSGNGLHLKWVYSGVIPAAALPRWNVVQKFLCLKFADLGADSSSLDAARVLRIPSSRNGKFDTKDRNVRVMRYLPELYTFDAIADAVLPVSRETIRNYEKTTQKRGGKKEKRSKKGTHIGIAGMYAKRYGDILKLLEMRRDANGNVPQGKRELAVFWALLCAAQAGTLTTANFDAMAQSIINTVGPDFTVECKLQVFKSLSCILSQVEAGDRLKEWKGQQVPRLYRVTTKRLIEILAITSEEQQQMAVLISAEEKKRRRTLKRREAGILPRPIWLAAHTQERDKPWKTANISRRTWFVRKARAAAMAERAIEESKKIRDAMIATVKKWLLNIAKREGMFNSNFDIQTILEHLVSCDGTLQKVPVPLPSPGTG